MIPVQEDSSPSQGPRPLAALAGVTVALTIILLAPAIQAEQRRRPTQYTVRQGDRVINIAKRFGLSVDEILEANGIVDARDLRAGQEITIPVKGRVAKRRSKRSKAVSYTIRQGDTLSEIADRFHIDTDELMDANGISNPRGIRVGQELVIPPPGGGGPGRPAKTQTARRGPEPPWMRRARRLASRLGLGGRRVANKLLRGQVENRWIRAAGRGRPPATLRFPVAGGFAGRGWGSGPGHYHLAFDIPGKMGARVSAAAPGIVAYAGEELAGYGKVVMIVHRGGLVTLYAHNSELKTVAGERVKAGTRIALLGNSGISRGPHVHFELIHHGKLCDPVPLMRPAPRNKAGRPVVSKRELAVWPRRGGPPKGVRCAARRRHPAYRGKPYGWRPKCWPHCNHDDLDEQGDAGTDD